MVETELLRAIKPIWIHRVTLALGKGAGIREDLRVQLERFFELLERVIDTGDPAWLDSILELWASSLTQSDLEDNTGQLTRFVKEITLQTTLVCRESLESEGALHLISALIPCFAYAFEKAAFYEMEARVAYVTNQLKQAQAALEKLDRSKSDFIAVAAHELKTPLTLIDGYASMLREVRERDLSNGDGRAFELEMLNGINNGASRLKTIIDDMIDASLIDNNLLKLHFQPLWINRLLSMLKNELEPVTRERRLHFEINNFPGSNEMTVGDPERLLQALRNVLANAVKYTPDGGEITVDGRKLPGFIEVLVCDSGIGIDPDDQAAIFDKFARIGNIALHSSGKTKFKGGGPGLGLHISKGIIESHGGAIWVDSPGYDEKRCPGTTFHILLPMKNELPDLKLARLISPLSNPTSSEEPSQ